MPDQKIMSSGNGVDYKAFIVHSWVLKHLMYVIYEHVKYRRKWPIFLRLLWSLPDTVFFIRVLVKVPKQFKGSLYRGSLSSSSMDQHSCSTVILRVALAGRNMRNNLTLDITTSSCVARCLRSDLSVL